MKPSLSILVPIFNEIKTVEGVLNAVTSLPIKNYEVILVDDGSVDGSREFLQVWHKKLRGKKRSMVQVILHERNFGKGQAIQTAVAAARGRYFVVQDADLEYNPSEIVPLLDYALAHKVQAVYGSRFMGKIQNMPLPNYIANRMYNIFLALLYNQRITDMHTCYKMVDTRLLKSLKLQSAGFDYAIELVSKLMKRGVKIYELPISFSGRNAKQGKKIDWKDGVRCFYLLFKYKVTRTL